MGNLCIRYECQGEIPYTSTRVLNLVLAEYSVLVCTMCISGAKDALVRILQEPMCGKVDMYRNAFNIKENIVMFKFSPGIQTTRLKIQKIEYNSKTLQSYEHLKLQIGYTKYRFWLAFW